MFEKAISQCYSRNKSAMKRSVRVRAFAYRPALGLAICLCGLGDSAAMLNVKTSTRTQTEPAVTLPKAQNANADSGLIGKESVVLVIPADGEFYLRGSRLNKADVPLRIRELLQDRSPDEQKIYIKSSATVQFRAVREAMNIMREIGYDRIGFIVESAAAPRTVAVFETRIIIPLGVKIDPSDKITLPPAPERSQNDPPPPPPPPAPPPPRRQPKVRTIPIDPFFGKDALVVEVKAAGSGEDQTIALNTRVMPLSDLQPFLANLFELRPNKRVFIKAAKDKAYGDVIAVMDKIKGAGAEPLLFLIDEVAVPRKIVNSKPPPPIFGVPGGMPGGVRGGEPPPPPPIIIRKSGGVLQSSATRRAEPDYPPEARAAGVSGAVVVEVTVDEAGHVIAARAISGHPLLKDAAVKAARGWKFTPTELSGVPVKVIGTLTFHFNM